MITFLRLVIATIGVDVIVSILTYFVNKWLDKYFDK